MPAPARYYRNAARMARNRRYAGYARKAGMSGAALGTAATAYLAYKGVKAIKKKLNTEFKWVDQSNVITTSGSATVANGQLYALNGLANGSGNSQREGNQVEFKSISMHVRMLLVAPATDNYALRMIIFKKKSPQGDSPVQGDVLLASAGADTNAFYNLDSVPQGAQVLSDKTFVLNSERPTLQTSVHIKKDIKTRYLGSTNGLSDIGTNGIYVMFIPNSSAGSGVEINCTSRLRYVDN